MRKLSFAIVSFAAATSIRVLHGGAQLVSTGIVWSAAKACQAVAKISYALMKVLDREAVEEYEVMVEMALPSSELAVQQTELNLLDAANKVKVHAETTGNWTDDHSNALEAVSNALLNECEWEEDDIHAYMKRLVESIDGLEYGTEER